MNAKERERLFEKFGPYDMIDVDVAFVMKNLALYNEDQSRRMTGTSNDVLQSQSLMKNDVSKPSLENDDTKEDVCETGFDYNEFFESSDVRPLTPESQKLLDQMFSS